MTDQVGGSTFKSWPVGLKGLEAYAFSYISKPRVFMRKFNCMAGIFLHESV